MGGRGSDWKCQLTTALFTDTLRTGTETERWGWGGLWKQAEGADMNLNNHKMEKDDTVQIECLCVSAVDGLPVMYCVNVSEWYVWVLVCTCTHGSYQRVTTKLPIYFRKLERVEFLKLWGVPSSTHWPFQKCYWPLGLLTESLMKLLPALFLPSFSRMPSGLHWHTTECSWCMLEDGSACEHFHFHMLESIGNLIFFKMVCSKKCWKEQHERNKMEMGNGLILYRTLSSRFI